MSKKLWVENISIPTAVYQENSPSENFLDMTNDAESWYKYGKLVMDIIHWRYKIQNILIPKANPNYPTIDFTGWSALTSTEKSIMSEMFLCPYALRLTVFSDEHDVDNWDYLLGATQGLKKDTNNFSGRALIVEKMRRFVADRVRAEEFPLSITQDFYKDVAQMCDWYIRAACPDFKCWLTNEVGSPYENDGFAQKSYYSEELRDELMVIYNGE